MSRSLVLPARGLMVANTLRETRSSFDRMRGLIGRPLREGEALLISSCRQVHTFGMREPIDVVFCDEEWTVLHVVSPMRPWRVGKWVRGARCAIELSPGAARGISPGDRFELVERPVGA